MALDRKALDVVILDVREASTYTDFLAIASGTSDRHVQSVAEHIARTLAKEGVKPVGTEGLREGQWALIDFGVVVVHIFHQYNREVYQLEELWADVPRLAVAEVTVARPAEL